MNGIGMTWLEFEVSIFRRPATGAAARPILIDGIEVAALDARALTRGNTFEIGFEDLQAALVSHPRTDVEPDGFLVRTGEADGELWRLQGHIFELEERVWRLDLSGRCPTQALDELLQAIGWPVTPVVFQLVQKGITVAEADFRRWATAVAQRSA